MNITTDTPEAAARRFLHVWTTMLGLTDRPDRARVEQLVDAAYQGAGLPAPFEIVWCSSPLVMAWTRSIFPLVSKEPVGVSVAEQLVHEPIRRAWNAVRSGARWEDVRPICEDLERGVGKVNKPREQALWEALGNDVLPFAEQPLCIRDSVNWTLNLYAGSGAADQIPATPRYLGIKDAVLGAMHPAAISLSFLRRRAGLAAETEAAAPLLDLLMETHMLIPFANICYLCEPPVLIDEQGAYYVDGWNLSPAEA